MSRTATAPALTFERVAIPPALSRACLAAKTAADNKGADILVLDLRGLTPMFDFFVLATGSSRRQVHTIVEEIDAALRAVGDSRMAVEGYDSSKWVVQDYGDVVAHVFDADTREYYKLDEVWADAKKVDWEAEYEDDLLAAAEDEELSDGLTDESDAEPEPV